MGAVLLLWLCALTFGSCGCCTKKHEWGRWCSVCFAGHVRVQNEESKGAQEHQEQDIGKNYAAMEEHPEVRMQTNAMHTQFASTATTITSVGRAAALGELA